MFNLTVSEIHTYYAVAGNAPVLVHNATCPVGFLDQGNGFFESPGGLFYGPMSPTQHRIDHIMEHTRPNTSKPSHTLFKKKGQQEVLDLIEDGWKKVDKNDFVLERGKRVYHVKYTDDIGDGGEKILRIVTLPPKKGRFKIISSFPVKNITDP